MFRLASILERIQIGTTGSHLGLAEVGLCTYPIPKERNGRQGFFVIYVIILKFNADSPLMSNLKNCQ